MLVLTRRINESVVITAKQVIQPGEKITVVLADCNHSKARLAFRASKNFEINRDEVEQEKYPS